jgi:hypothetical protein
MACGWLTVGIQQEADMRVLGQAGHSSNRLEILVGHQGWNRWHLAIMESPAGWIVGWRVFLSKLVGGPLSWASEFGTT